MKKTLLLIGLFLLLGLVYLWPLPLHFFSDVPFGLGPAGRQLMRAGDHLESLYFFWNFKDALLSGRNPFYAYYHFATGGPPEVVGLTRFPFTLVFVAGSLVSDIFSYNAILVLSFVLSGLAAFALAYYYVRDWPSALLAGVIYCLNPFYFSQLLSGHINAPLSFSFPLFLLCLELVRKGRKWAGWAAAAILVSVAFSAEVHILLFLLLVLIFFLLWKICPAWLREKHFPGQLVPWLIVLGGLTAALGYTLLMKRLIVGSSTLAGGRSLQEVLVYSAPILFPLLRSSVSRYLYFGVLPLALAGLALFGAAAGEKNVRRWFWPAVVMTAALVLLAPLLAGQLGSRHLASQVFHWALLPAAFGLIWLVLRIRETDLAFYGFLLLFGYFFCLGAYLPVYPWLHRWLPLLNYFRDPTRAGIMVYAALAVLAAIGYKRLIAKRSGGRLILVLLLVALDYKWTLSIGLCRLDRQEPVYAYVKEHHQAGEKILELPLLTGTLHYNSVYEYYICQHRTPIINGYHPYPPLSYDRVYTELREINRRGRITPEQWDLIRQLQIKYLVVHRDLFETVPQKYLLFPPPDPKAINLPWGAADVLNGLQRQPGLELIAEQDGLYLFRVK